MRLAGCYLPRRTIVLQNRDEIISVVININAVISTWRETSRVAEAYSDASLASVIIFNIYIKLDVRSLNTDVPLCSTAN
jgi:hypothetical protein